jgi:hypothetical protein
MLAQTRQRFEQTAVKISDFACSFPFKVSEIEIGYDYRLVAVNVCPAEALIVLTFILFNK